LSIKPAKVKKVVKALARLGFSLERIHGSHLVFKHKDGRITVVPRHGNEEIGRGMLRKIALDARMSPEEFYKVVEES